MKITGKYKSGISSFLSHVPGTRANNIPQPFITCSVCCGLTRWKKVTLCAKLRIRIVQICAQHIVVPQHSAFSLEVWRLEKVDIVVMPDYFLRQFMYKWKGISSRRCWWKAFKWQRAGSVSQLSDYRRVSTVSTMSLNRYQFCPARPLWGRLYTHVQKQYLYFNICSALSVHFTASAVNWITLLSWGTP